MAIANPWLLILGTLFVSIPIALHMLLRQKPKEFIFPALRFVKQQRETNQRKLQLRHLLLLLLRCCAIAVLAAALARPSAVAESVGHWTMIAILALVLILVALLTAIAWICNKGRLLIGVLAGLTTLSLLGLIGLVVLTFSQGARLNIGNREAPVAAAMVIDSSPRMQYRQSNRTRLEQAKEFSQWLVRQFPTGSQVAVVDSGVDIPFFSVDVAAAAKRIETLETTYAGRPIVTTIDKALRLVQESQLQRKEIYVFSDMTQAAWQGDARGALRQRLQESSDVTLYLIDVGVASPTNFALGDLELESESLPRTGELTLSTELHRVGPGDERAVELHLERPDLTKPVMVDGKLQVPDEHWIRTVTRELPENGSEQIQFRLGGLELGVHQGYVQIIGQDGLAVDDRRYFTIHVKDAWPILVTEPKGGTSRFLTEALAPYQQKQTGDASYTCSVVPPNGLQNEELDQFAAVALLDPGPLPPLVWEELAKYVESGGSVIIFLGHNARADETFNGKSPQRLLPGQLLTLLGRSSGDVIVSTPRSFDHPIPAAFRGFSSSVPWQNFPIYRYWVVADLAADTTEVIPLSNNRPLLIERAVGKGRALTMTTPISDPARPQDRIRWNDLPLGEAWPYFILVNAIFDHLVETGATKLNYLVGQTATLLNEESEFPKKYDLFLPSGPPQQIQSQQDRLVIPNTKLPGAYRLRGSRGGPVVRGFSVNVPFEASRLQRLEEGQLDEILGSDSYLLARDRAEIHRGQGEARLGREFYPLLVMVLAGVLAMEFLMANRFYGREKPSKST